jgi:hypothetical protein
MLIRENKAKVMSDKNWHKPNEKEKLDEANRYFGFNKSKRKRLDWWDKLKVSFYEDEANANFEVIEPKQLPESST